MKKLQQKCKIYYKIQQKLWLKKKKNLKNFLKIANEVLNKLNRIFDRKLWANAN